MFLLTANHLPVTIFLAACLVIFLLPNTVFAWFEYVTSLIKIILFLLLIFVSLALVFGAGPNGYFHHGETWTEQPAFLNGFSVRVIPGVAIGQAHIYRDLQTLHYLRLGQLAIKSSLASLEEKPRIHVTRWRMQRNWCPSESTSFT